MTAERHAPPVRELEEYAGQGRITVGVEMRVEMAGRMTHELLEAGELPRQLGTTAGRASMSGCARETIESRMESHAQLAGITAHSRRLEAPGPVDQQTRAGDDAVAIRIQDSAIDAGTHSEFIRIDDQPSHRGILPRAGSFETAITGDVRCAPATERCGQATMRAASGGYGSAKRK